MTSFRLVLVKWSAAIGAPLGAVGDDSETAHHSSNHRILAIATLFAKVRNGTRSRNVPL